MPVTYYAGKAGKLDIEGTCYSLRTWSYSPSVTPINVSNFCNANTTGAEIYIPGLIGGTITAEGVSSSLGIPVYGTYATVTPYLDVVGTVTLPALEVLITGVKVDSDVADASTFTIDMQITGLL